MSRNTMGASSTNPPAVIRRDLPCFLGAWAAPVAIPMGEDWVVFSIGRFSAGTSCPVLSEAKSRIAGKITTTATFECRFRISSCDLFHQRILPLAESGLHVHL